jgi:hypothetical protein
MVGHCGEDVISQLEDMFRFDRTTTTCTITTCGATADTTTRTTTTYGTTQRLTVLQTRPL